MTKRKETTPEEAQYAPETTETMETEVSMPKGKSEAYRAYKAIVDAYKVRNPEKYELKRAAFEKKLASL